MTKFFIIASFLTLITAMANTPEFPKEMKVGTSSLVLNGIGIRKVTIFSVKVYYAGLYLEKKSADSKAILDSKEVKKIEMKFVKDVDKEKIVKAWKEGIEKNCTFECEKVKEAFPKLVEYLSDVKEGETMAVVFHPGKLEYYFNDTKKGEVENEPLAKSVLATWLGRNPPNKDLQEGMLGLAK